MFLTRLRVVAVVALVGFVVGCAKKEGEVSYCDPSDESWHWYQRHGTIQIDLEQRWIYGGDTASELYPFVHEDFVGFEAAFPLLLFSDSVDPAEFLDDIVVNDIIFRISPVEGTFGDLWLITAEPEDAESEQAWRQRSTVLFSTEDGVLLIALSAAVEEQRFPVNLVPCEKRTLRYEDIHALLEDEG